MEKNSWSKISWLFLGIMPLLLIACGVGTSTPQATPTVTVTLSSPAASTVAETTDDAMTIIEAVTTEDEILPVSAKPQLIEFYAEW